MENNLVDDPLAEFDAELESVNSTPKTDTSSFTVKVENKSDEPISISREDVFEVTDENDKNTSVV